MAHLQATLQLFRRNETDPNPVYMGLTRIFRRGEITTLGLEALRSAPDGLDTRELTKAVMVAKGGFDRQAFEEAQNARLS